MITKEILRFPEDHIHYNYPQIKTNKKEKRREKNNKSEHVKENLENWTLEITQHVVCFFFLTTKDKKATAHTSLQNLSF